MKIGELLEQAGKEAIILTGDDGTKETLLQQIKAPVSIVHLATHAFYWKEKSSKKNIIPTCWFTKIVLVIIPTSVCVEVG